MQNAQCLEKRQKTEAGSTTTADLLQIHQRLKKECKGDLGFFNPSKAFSFLNIIQKEGCPEAYEPEIVIQQRQKEEERKKQQTFYNEIDKTLFDFDDEIDNLSNVSERYKVQAFYLIDKSRTEKKEVKQTKTISQTPIKEEVGPSGKNSKLSRKKRKSSKKQGSFTLDQAKQEMIKDLKYHNLQDSDD